MPEQITVASRVAHDVDLGGPTLPAGSRATVDATPHVRHLIDAGVVADVTTKRRKTSRAKSTRATSGDTTEEK